MPRPSDNSALFDRACALMRRQRARRMSHDGADFLLRRAAQETIERLAVVSRQFDVALELGGHEGQVTQALEQLPNVSSVLQGDVVSSSGDAGQAALVLREDLLPFAPESLDLIVSVLTLHTVNDLPGALIQMRKALKPDGLLLACLPGGETLCELRDTLLQAELEITAGVTPRVSPFAGARDMGALLQRAGFALPVADQDRIIVRYDHLFDLMKDLRAMGATNILTERSKKPASRMLFQRAAELYAQKYSDPDGRVRATFDLVSLSGWAPHEDQQKPLAPGSAKIRLADALGAKEYSAGESHGRNHKSSKEN